MNRRKMLAAMSATLLPLPRVACAQNLSTIRVIGPPNDGYKAVYYALGSGLFKKYGVNVEPTTINSGAAAAAALIGGAADVGYTNPTVVILGHTRGVAMQILTPGGLISRGSPVSSILVLKDSKIRTGSDLNGATIGAVALGDTMSTSIRAWIDQNGGDASTVKFVEVPSSASLQMLVEGRVAAAGLNEPAITQALASGKVRSLANPLDAIGNQFLGGAFAVMAATAAANADALQRFARAMHESQTYTNSHLPDTVGVVAGYSGIAPEIVAHSVRVIDADYVEVRYLQPLIDVLAKYKTIEKPFPATEIISPLALKPRR